MRLHLRGILAATALAATMPAAAAMEAGGVRFDDSTPVGTQTLALNGAGVRTRFMFKVYAMGLYLPQRETKAEAILATPGAKRVHIVTLRDLGSDQFVDALVDGLKKNHAAETLAALGPSIDAFRAAMSSVKAAPEGTVVLLDWIPGSGTRLTIGGNRAGSDIPDEAFYRALLRVWLGDRPADDELKQQLLAAGRPG